MLTFLFPFSNSYMYELKKNSKIFIYCIWKFRWAWAWAKGISSRQWYTLKTSPWVSTMRTSSHTAFCTGYMVLSKVDYCNALLTRLSACAAKCLQIFKNAAALVFAQAERTHTPLIVSLHWLPISARIQFRCFTLAFMTSLKHLIQPQTTLVI